MSTIWLTYAWDDNRDKDVDFVAQELEREGLKVHLDRWNVGAGKRLWEQIAEFILDPARSDGWMIYATQTSLSSEPCQEELAYALNRALSSRTAAFPIIALFPSRIDERLIPASISIRLHVSITDADWKERVKAAADGRPPEISRTRVLPYVVKQHAPDPDAARQGYITVVEMRPRAGVWCPFYVAVPVAEKHKFGNPLLNVGPKDHVPGLPSMALDLKQYSRRVGGDDWFIEARTLVEATPTLSYYLYCRELPNRLIFGVERTSVQFEMNACA